MSFEFFLSQRVVPALYNSFMPKDLIHLLSEPKILLKITADLIFNLKKYFKEFLISLLSIFSE